MINDALSALSGLPSLIVSFERKQLSLKPSVLEDAESKLVISETKNDLFASVFDRVIKILAPPAACAVMSSMVEVEADVEKILPRPQAVVVPTQRDDQRRRDGPDTRQNSRRVVHHQTTSNNVHQSRGRGRGGTRGGSRGRGGQSRGGGSSTLPVNSSSNRGGRGASGRGRVDHGPVVKPKSRSPIRRNDFHRRSEADGSRKKINFDHARRNRSFHSNAGVNVVEEESSSPPMNRSDRVVATTDVLSGVEIPKVFSNEELLLARRQFFDDVSAGASRARRLVDVLGIDVDDQRPFDNMVEIGDGSRPKWRVVVDDVRRQFTDESAGISDYTIIPADMRRFEEEIQRWRKWTNSPGFRRKMNILKKEEEKVHLRKEEEESRRRETASKTIDAVLKKTHDAPSHPIPAEDGSGGDAVDKDVDATPLEASFEMVDDDLSQDSAASEDDDERLENTSTAPAGDVDEALPESEAVDDNVEEQMSVEVHCGDSEDDDSIPSLISTSSSTPTRIFISNGLAARRILRREDDAVEACLGADWPPASATPSFYRRMQALGIDHPNPIVQVPLLRDLADRVGEMALHVGGIRRPSETYHGAAARLGVKGLDEYRRSFEKKALSKVVELSKLDPIKVFEDKVLEKVKMNRKWAEQRTEFLLKKIKRKERADSTEEEKCEIYISESDDSSDE